MTAPSKVRVRFAPSPTGYLHIGGARTALFNWLYARRFGGTFVLRIEDTDVERSTDESTRGILDAMRWLGLEWDEGPGVGGPHAPYTQTERLATYRGYADRLVAEGKAYRCYATKEELDALRKETKAKGQEFFYPHLWRDKSEADWLPAKPYVVRIKAPLDGDTTFDDLVFGKIKTPNNTIQDFVLMRSDGVPLYNMGAVVDDIEMGITLVGRGRDHVINTPQQILIYQALGAAVPTFAHLPMMLTPDGKKLSKRDADRYDIPVSVAAYRERGFTPEGLLNYLVRFGWSHGDQEVFSRAQMVELFDFADVNKADGKFDMKKCLSVNHSHLKDPALTPPDSYVEGITPFLERRGLDPRDRDKVARATATVRVKHATYLEAADAVDYYFRDEVVWDEAAKAKFLTPDAAPRLRELARRVGAVEPFDAPALDACVHAWLQESGSTMKEVGQAIRVALTGRAISPQLFDVMAVLGREVTLARLDAGASLAESAGAPPKGA